MAENETLLRQVIATHFEALLYRYAFKEDWHESDDDSDYEVLNLRSPNFFLRFTTDRGCLCVEICPLADSRWIDLALLLEFLGHPLDLINTEIRHGIVFVEEGSPLFARALEMNFEIIVDLLQPQTFDQTLSQFNAFRNARAKRLVGVKE